MIIAEATTHMVTDVEMLYVHKDDGFVEIAYSSISSTVEIDILALGFTALFLIFFLMNVYLFISGEFMIY